MHWEIEKRKNGLEIWVSNYKEYNISYFIGEVYDNTPKENADIIKKHALVIKKALNNIKKGN